MCKSIPGCEYPQVELMASYICSKCRFEILAPRTLFTINHLKTHRDTPHTPKNCKKELREICDFMENFLSNVVDYRVGTVNKKGKGPLLFP